jgi:hypothetical protein
VVVLGTVPDTFVKSGLATLPVESPLDRVEAVSQCLLHRPLSRFLLYAERQGIFRHRKWAGFTCALSAHVFCESLNGETCPALSYAGWGGGLGGYPDGQDMAYPGIDQDGGGDAERANPRIGGRDVARRRWTGWPFNLGFADQRHAVFQLDDEEMGHAEVGAAGRH